MTTWANLVNNTHTWNSSFTSPTMHPYNATLPITPIRYSNQQDVVACNQTATAVATSTPRVSQILAPVRDVVIDCSTVDPATKPVCNVIASCVNGLNQQCVNALTNLTCTDVDNYLKQYPQDRETLCATMKSVMKDTERVQNNVRKIRDWIASPTGPATCLSTLCQNQGENVISPVEVTRLARAVDTGLCGSFWERYGLWMIIIGLIIVAILFVFVFWIFFSRRQQDRTWMDTIYLEHEPSSDVTFMRGAPSVKEQGVITSQTSQTLSTPQQITTTTTTVAESTRQKMTPSSTKTVSISRTPVGKLRSLDAGVTTTAVATTTSS